MLTTEDIATIKERAKKATAGPWQYEQYELGPLENTARLYYSGSEKPFADFRGGLNQDQDAEFIAHARTDIPALLAHVEELEEKNAQLFADWRRMKEVLEIAEPYIVDPDEWIGVNSMTLEYRSPLSKEQKLQKEIESVRKTKADKKKVNDVLRSLSYTDSPSKP